jgi:hypothetical protein
MNALLTAMVDDLALNGARNARRACEVTTPYLETDDLSNTGVCCVHPCHEATLRTRMHSMALP